MSEGCWGWDRVKFSAVEKLKWHRFDFFLNFFFQKSKTYLHKHIESFLHSWLWTSYIVSVQSSKLIPSHLKHQILLLFITISSNSFDKVKLIYQNFSLIYDTFKLFIFYFPPTSSVDNYIIIHSHLPSYCLLTLNTKYLSLSYIL